MKKILDLFKNFNKESTKAINSRRKMFNSLKMVKLENNKYKIFQSKQKIKLKTEINIFMLNWNN